jgi:hypothetical protein
MHSKNPRRQIPASFETGPRRPSATIPSLVTLDQASLVWTSGLLSTWKAAFLRGDACSLEVLRLLASLVTLVPAPALASPEGFTERLEPLSPGAPLALQTFADPS